jgi:MFS family permease
MSFIVGFAMLGGITFLPTYLQYVQGTSATVSGIRMLPMVLGLLIAAISSGNVVSKTGRYRVFPIAGSIGMAGGLYLLSKLDEHTRFWTASVYMFVLGVGVGLAMQVLLIAVQNTVEYSDLGVATSGVTFLRTIGSSFGVAVFGSVYSSKLGGNIAAALAGHPLPAGVDPRAVQSPEALHKLPAAISAPVVHAYAQSLHVVFLAGVPVALAALVLSLFLKEVPLRGTSRAAVTELGDGFAMPESADADQSLQKALAGLLRKERGQMSTVALAHAHSPLDEAEAWCVVKVRACQRKGGPATVAGIAESVRVPEKVLRPAFDNVIAAGYLADGLDGLRLTDRGEQEFGTLSAAWQEWVAERLADWNPEAEVALPAALARLARQLFEEQPTDPAPVPAGAR